MPDRNRLPKSSSVKIDDAELKISGTLDYAIDDKDEMTVSVSVTIGSWTASEAMLYDAPAGAPLTRADRERYVDAVIKGRPPWAAFDTKAAGPPFIFQLTKTFIGRCAILGVTFKRGDDRYVFAKAIGNDVIPSMTVMVGDDEYCTIFRDSDDNGAPVYRWWQRGGALLAVRTAEGGAVTTEDEIDVEQCPVLPEEGLQFFAIFVYGSVLEQIFVKASKIGSDYLRSSFDEMAAKGASSMTLYLKPANLAFASALWHDVAANLPHTRENLDAADAHCKDFLDDTKPWYDRLWSFCAFVGCSILVVLDWVPFIPSAPAASECEAATEDAIKVLRQQAEEHSQQVIEQYQAVKKAIPAKAAQIDQHIQKVQDRITAMRKAFDDIGTKLHAAAQPGATKAELAAAKLAWAQAGDRLFAARKLAEYQYWETFVQNGKAKDLLASGSSASQGHLVQMVGGVEGGLGVGGREVAWEYTMLKSELDQQKLLDQIAKRYTGPRADALKNYVKKWFADPGKKSARIDFFQIDHKTKCLEVSDYTGSYVDPMSGTKGDHMTKTIFYLEAYIQQLLGKGKDLLSAGYDCRAVEMYWRESHP
jgi:hypothetical protein